MQSTRSVALRVQPFLGHTGPGGHLFQAVVHVQNVLVLKAMY